MDLSHFMGISIDSKKDKGILDTGDNSHILEYKKDFRYKR